MILSFKIIMNLKEMSREFKDNTVEISEKVRKIIKSKYRLYRRLVNAFPRIKENVLYEKWEEMKQRVEESKEEIRNRIDSSKEELRNKIDSSKMEIGEIIDISKQNLKNLYKKK